MAGPLIGGGRPISWRLAGLVAVLVLFISNAELKAIFGRGEISTDIPFLLFGLILFATWRINRRAANRQNGLLGSARFGDRADVRKLEANGDLLIGRSAKSGKLLHYDGVAHLLTMAPTRSGKGVGTIIPNLLLLDRSVICIDPKGENARVTARARAAKGPVWCLDPFEVSGQLPARYNPLDRLDTYARWLRLLVSQAVTDMARSTARPARPVLFLLDEFAALGRLEPVERAMGLMAGYGMQLWPILQDMHQLKANYGEKAGTFMSNAGVIQAFGINDHATADMLSRTLGDTTVEYDTVSTSRGIGWGNNSSSPTESIATHVTARRLATPDEIMLMRPDQVLLLRQGERPLPVEKIRYYDQREFAGLFDAA